MLYKKGSSFLVFFVVIGTSYVRMERLLLLLATFPAVVGFVFTSSAAVEE